MLDCGSNINEFLNPETSFVISEDNKCKIKELLINLQKEKLLEDEKQALGEQNLRVLDTMTNLLFEALQFINIIPNVLTQDIQNEIEELKKVAEAFDQIKNNLIDFKNLIA